MRGELLASHSTKRTTGGWKNEEQLEEAMLVYQS